jgi:hypothetical protein
MHLFGISDRYVQSVDGNGNRVTTPNVGFEGDAMGATTQNIGETHYRMYSEYFSRQSVSSGELKTFVDVDSRGNLLSPTLQELIKYSPPPLPWEKLKY